MAKNVKLAKRRIIEAKAHTLNKKAYTIATAVLDNEENATINEIYEALDLLNDILYKIHALTLKELTVSQFYMPVRHFVFVVEKLRNRKLEKLYGTHR